MFFTIVAFSKTVDFQILLVQVFDSVSDTLTHIPSDRVGVDCHVEFPQKHESFAVAVMTLQRKPHYQNTGDQGRLSPFKLLLVYGFLRKQQ